jgi:hypothetical protein
MLGVVKRIEWEGAGDLLKQRPHFPSHHTYARRHLGGFKSVAHFLFFQELEHLGLGDSMAWHKFGE